MSGEPQGLAAFPGVDQVASWSVSLRHGVSPSTFLLTTAPQEDFVAEIGDLDIEFGDVAFTFSDCKIDRAEYHQGPSGIVWTLSILDRRWMWQGFGLLSGAYNLRNDDNSLSANTIVETLQGLLSLCLDALGEEGYDVGDAPDVGNPTVEWDAVCPADALADLCDQFGLRVVLRSDDTVKICVVGEGAELPLDETVMENSLAIDLTGRPDQTAIVCAPNRYQADLPLIPIAADVDGSLQPVDEVSYAPQGGWQSVDLVDFRAVDPDYRSLAQKWVFRAYQISAPLVLAEYGQVSDLDQILPIESEQVALESDSQGDSSNAPAIVFGQFFAGGETAANNVDSLPADFGDLPDEAIYDRPFAIDRRRGVVWFRDQVYCNQNPAVPVIPIAANIFLRAAVSVRDPQTGGWTRYTRTRGGNQADGVTLYEKHDEIVYVATPRYVGQAIGGSVNNADSVNAQCDALLDAIDCDFNQTYPQTVKYAGVVQIELDGSIQQVVWQGGPHGATTTASYNQESPGLGPSYPQRRACENQGRVADLLRLEQPVILARQLKTLSIP